MSQKTSLAESMLHILVVDDSQIARSFHIAALAQAGYACSAAESGAEAIELALRKPFDAIVTDLNMPRMDGYELSKRLRALEGYAETPILMITSEREDHDRMRAMNCGVNTYITKPIEPDTLCYQLGLLIGKRARTL